MLLQRIENCSKSLKNMWDEKQKNEEERCVLGIERHCRRV